MSDMFDVSQGGSQASKSIKKLSKHVMRAFETSPDNAIDFQEFLTIAFVMTNGPKEEILKQIYKVFDINGDGKVKPEEMKRSIKALSCLLTDEERMGSDAHPQSPKELAKFLFEEMDENKDKSISLEEFIKAIDSNKKLSSLFTLKIVEIIGDRY